MRFSGKTLPLLCAFLAGAAGCSYDEGLIIENLQGTIRVPVEAATRQVVVASGETETITDARLIGPVYLGLYPGIEAANVIERYPHPEIGPQYIDDVQGNTYPYGGTALGDLRYACFEELSCKMTSGRFVDWQSIIDWFALIQQPVLDNFGREIDNAEFLRQSCYDLLDVTSDAEIRITVSEDRNGDGQFTELDLQFVLDDSGEYFEAPFTIWQQEFFYDVDQDNCTPGTDCRGFSLWGWMDGPAVQDFSFSTCHDNAGFDTEVYDSEFRVGSVWFDILNFPAQYIGSGDWVSSQPFRWDDVNDEPTLALDFEVQ